MSVTDVSFDLEDDDPRPEDVGAVGYPEQVPIRRTLPPAAPIRRTLPRDQTPPYAPEEPAKRDRPKEPTATEEHREIVAAPKRPGGYSATLYVNEEPLATATGRSLGEAVGLLLIRNSETLGVSYRESTEPVLNQEILNNPFEEPNLDPMR